MALDIIYDNCNEFLNRTGSLDFEDFLGFELQPDWGDALFTEQALPRVKEFVACHEGYHIISCGIGIMYNRLIEGMRLYRLAWGGDANPRLTYVDTEHTWINYEFDVPLHRSGAKGG